MVMEICVEGLFSLKEDKRNRHEVTFVMQQCRLYTVDGNQNVLPVDTFLTL